MTSDLPIWVIRQLGSLLLQRPPLLWSEGPKVVVAEALAVHCAGASVVDFVSRVLEFEFGHPEIVVEHGEMIARSDTGAGGR